MTQVPSNAVRDRVLGAGDWQGVSPYGFGGRSIWSILGRIPGLPMGSGGRATFQPQSTGLPPVVTETANGEKIAIPEQIDRRDQPLPEAPNVIHARDWFDYSEKMKLGIPVGKPTTWSRLQQSTASKPMDLGSLISDLGSQYIQTRYAPTMQQPIPTTPAFVPPAVVGGAMAGAAAAGLDMGLPFVDVIPQPPSANCGGGKPVYKYHCGEYKWVYPKRRRRKALATQSDLKSLAALKGVLGQGKAFEVWIATHS